MIRLACRMLKERSGNFGLMFAFMAVPVVAAVGCATDFSYALTVRTQLQHAADSAAVSALAEQSVGVIAGLKDSIIGEVAVGGKDAEKVFKANMDPKLAAYITSYSMKIQRNATQFTSQVQFSATIPTTFLGIIGKNSIKIAGVAQGSYVPATYVDFYLMLDNSPSMGLGATTVDIETLQNATKNKSSDANCAFACHDMSNANNYYNLAKSLGVTTRIQLVSKAAQAMMTTAKSTRKYSDQYRMAVYSMGAKAESAQLTNVAPMSSDLDAAASKTATIDLMSIPKQNYNGDQQTDMLTNLTALKSTMGAGGSGLNATDRQKVLFLVSDGVEDANRPSGCLKKLSGSTRCQAPLDYSICTKIKAAGVRIAVLYTTYQPLPKNDWYNTWIKPFGTQINSNMQACASDGLFFEVSPSQGITEAMNALFLKVINLPKLTG